MLLFPLERMTKIKILTIIASASTTWTNESWRAVVLGQTLWNCIPG